MIRQNERSGTATASGDLGDLFGPIDIYVFDQILRGRLAPGMRILDAGCGSGRNSRYLMTSGADLYAVDGDPAEVERIRNLAENLAPGLGPGHFHEARLDALPFDDTFFDAVMCNAVLHFARDEADFEAMMSEMWRVLRSGGIFFARLASSIGIENRLSPLRDRWHLLPDGTERFLVDAAFLAECAERLGGRLVDPLKTTLVETKRSMTTWVLQKT